MSLKWPILCRVERKAGQSIGMWVASVAALCVCVCSSVGSAWFAVTLVWCSWTTNAPAVAALVHEWIRCVQSVVTVMMLMMMRWLFCSLAVLDLSVGHTMDVLSPFISVLCHSDRLFHGESCPHLDVAHPGCAWSSSPTCTWHCSLHYLFLQATPLSCFLMVWPWLWC